MALTAGAIKVILSTAAILFIAAYLGFGAQVAGYLAIVAAVSAAVLGFRLL